MTQLPKIEYLRQYFVHKFQDDKGHNRVLFIFWNFGQNVFLKFHCLGYQVIKITTIIVFDTHTIRIFVWITQKLFQKSGI